MSQSYNKVTLAVLRARIKEGQYETIAGANRAIGKASELTDEEKEAARRTAANYFGESPPKPSAKTASAKSGGAPKGRKKTSKKVSKAHTSSDAEAAQTIDDPAQPALPRGARVHQVMVDEQGLALSQQRLHLVAITVDTAKTALSTLHEAKALHPGLDVTQGVVAAYGVLAHAVSMLDGSDAYTSAASKPARPKPAAKPAQPETVQSPVGTPAAPVADTDSGLTASEQAQVGNGASAPRSNYPDILRPPVVTRVTTPE